MTRSEKFEAYKDRWRSRTRRQVEKEIESWRKYFQKHDSSYALHGDRFTGSVTPPNELPEGMKLMALREVLEEMQ